MEAEYERLFELSLDLLAIADFDGYFRRVNPAWERTLGLTEAELLGRPFLDFVHPDDRERTAAEASRLAASPAQTVSFRNRYRAADGSYRWLEWSARSIDGEERIYAAARDVTAQRAAEDLLHRRSELLEEEVRARTSELEESRLETLRSLALAGEYRDDATLQHAERVGRAAALIASEFGLPDELTEAIRRAAPLHDLGKLGISDAILLKPGGLSESERERIREHPGIGAAVVAGSRWPVLQMAETIALTHHERWDGTGYPSGLRGEEIPLEGRIVGLADAFDALTHDRPYKDAWPLERAIEEIEARRGTQFDPGVVEAFAAVVRRHDLLAPVR